jgi:hypothetical protein
MASRRTYTCFVCEKTGHQIQVFLDGKDEQGRTKYLNEDMTIHTHLGSSQPMQQQQTQEQPQQGSSTIVTTEPTSLKINAKLDRIIALLESKERL